MRDIGVLGDNLGERRAAKSSPSHLGPGEPGAIQVAAIELGVAELRVVETDLLHFRQPLISIPESVDPIKLARDQRQSFGPKRRQIQTIESGCRQLNHLQAPCR